jgi:hypothetical protein
MEAGMTPVQAAREFRTWTRESLAIGASATVEEI